MGAGGVVASGQMLKALYDVAHAIKLREFSVIFQGNRASVCAADGAHVAIIAAEMHVESGPAEPLELLFDVEKYKEVAKAFGGDKEVALDVKGAQVKFKVGRRSRTMMTLDPRETQRPTLPPLEWPATAVVPTSFLRECLRNSPSKADSMAFEAKDGLLHFYAADEGATDVYEDSVESPTLAQGVQVRSLFAVDYVTDIVASVASQDMRIGLGTNFPARFEFGLADGTATVLLAARVVADS